MATLARTLGDTIERHLEDGFDLVRLRALYFERLEPNRQMIDFVRELRGRRVA